MGEGSGMFGSVTGVAQRSSALALDAREQRSNLIILGVIALHSYATAPSGRNGSGGFMDGAGQGSAVPANGIACFHRCWQYN